MRSVWAEIDLMAIAYNCQKIQALLKPDTGFMAVVKGNAYGHGAVEIAKTVLGAGASYLGVATQEEGLELRRGGITAPILILGFTPLEDALVTVSHGLAQTIYSLEQGMVLSKVAISLGVKAVVHIKIDTGMGRLGFIPEGETIKEIAQLISLPGLMVQGIYTHFADADSPDKKFVRWQLERFQRLTWRLELEGLKIPIKHAANSAAIMELPETHLDLVRPGIILYGLYPAERMNKGEGLLRPALSLKAKVVNVKEVAAGTPISYGRTHYTNRPTKIATLPLGYADGLMRLLSNQGEALIGGRRVPIVGRICMDQCMLDVTEIKSVEIGDEAVFIGRQGEEEILADELAEKVGTISYEIVSVISPRVRREYFP